MYSDISALELYVAERKAHMESYCKSFNIDPTKFDSKRWALDKVVELWKAGELHYNEAMKKAVEIW